MFSQLQDVCKLRLNQEKPMNIGGYYIYQNVREIHRAPGVYVICNTMSVEPLNIVCMYVTDMI